MSDYIQTIKRLTEKFRKEAESIPRNITSLLYPEWVQAIPSKAICTWTLSPSCHEKLCIPANTNFTASHAQARDISLHTLIDTEILPLTLVDLRYQKTVLGAELKCRLATYGEPIELTKLTFYLNMPWPEVGVLVHALMHSLVSTRLELGSHSVEIPVLTPVFLGNPSFDPQYHWVSYLVFPQQFLFVETDFPALKLSEATLVLSFTQYQPELKEKLGEKSLCLNAIPVINSEQRIAQPLSFSFDDLPLAVTPLATIGEPPSEIYRVESVELFHDDESQKIECYPIFQRPFLTNAQQRLYWHATFDEQWKLNFAAMQMEFNDDFLCHIQVRQCDAGLPQSYTGWQCQPQLTAVESIECITNFSRYIPARDCSKWEMLGFNRCEVYFNFALLQEFNPDEAERIATICASITRESAMTIDPQHFYAVVVQRYFLTLSTDQTIERYAVALHILYHILKLKIGMHEQVELIVQDAKGARWTWPISTK